MKSKISREKCRTPAHDYHVWWYIIRNLELDMTKNVWGHFLAQKCHDINKNNQKKD